MSQQTNIVLPAAAASVLPKQGRRFRIVMVAGTITPNAAAGVRKCALIINDGIGAIIAAFWASFIDPALGAFVTWTPCSPGIWTTYALSGSFDPVTGAVNETLQTAATDTRLQVVSIPERLIIEPQWSPQVIFDGTDNADLIALTWTIEIEPTFRE